MYWLPVTLMVSFIISFDFPAGPSTKSSYPVTLFCAVHDTASCSLPGSGVLSEGILKSGAGILLSISLTNSTLAISASLLFFLVPVILIVTLLTATCVPRLSISEPSGSVVTDGDITEAL